MCKTISQKYFGSLEASIVGRFVCVSAVLSSSLHLARRRHLYIGMKIRNSIGALDEMLR
jgi:hypothetical protein